MYDFSCSTTIGTQHHKGPLSPMCLATSRLPQRLWDLGILVKFLYLTPKAGIDDFHIDDFHIDDNVVGIYNNVTHSLLSQSSERGGLLNAAWLMIIPPERRTEIMNQANDLRCFLDSTFLVALYSECQAQIESPYRVGSRAAGAIFENLGSWNDSRGYTLHSNISKLTRRSDFQGYPMRGIGVKVFKFFTTYLNNSEVSGYVGDIVTTLKNVHNFTLTYRQLEGYAYGTVIDAKKNIWNGIVGELQSRRADITVSELAISKERVKVVDYTQPVYVVSYNLFTSTPEDFKQKVLAYVHPMEPILYVCVFFTMVILVITLVVLERLRYRFLPEEMEGGPTEFNVASWYMISAICQQGSDTEPSGIGSRLIFWFGYILSLLVYTSYSATLVSQLAVERPATLPFSNLFELSKQTDWDAGNNAKDFFQVIASQVCVNSTTEGCKIMNRIWTDIIMKKPNNLAVNYTDGLKKVLKGKYVFIAVDVSTRYFLSLMPPAESCRIKILPGRYLPVGLGVGLQHSSPFKTIFDSSIQKMRENGLLNKLRLKYLQENRLCSQDTTVTRGLLDVATLFLLLMAGIGLSIILFICEIGVSKVKLREYIEEEDV